MLAQQDPGKVEFGGLFRPEEFADTARVTRAQPYDPDKTVVLIIHGLKASPATWVPMFNRLIADDQIRRSCQFWFFSYPTGYPYPHSAAILRRELDAIERRFPLRRKMVVIGHSMGGCIGRLLITDTGDVLWRAMFDTPPAETPISPESKALLREALIFRHRPEIGRVIFIAAPLRGSELAGHWIGRTASALVKVPSSVESAGHDVLRNLAFEGSKRPVHGVPTSLDTLAPDDPFVLTIQDIPVTPGIPHHVICGDRGRGGNRDRTKPVMTDGVVPFWSSHMKTAGSEFIAPAGHGVHRSPEAIAEVLRILKEHVRHD
jgi:pimeloyl-ACP methyl ester carboxylesterase